MSTVLCCIPACHNERAGGSNKPMCAVHWEMLPRRIRELLRQQYVPGEPTYPYLMVLSAAITAVLLKRTTDDEDGIGYR